MRKPYEVVYIFDSALEEAAIAQKLDQFHALIASPGAEPPTLNHWGKRTLAYAIRKRDTGYYVVANFETEPAKLPEYERALKLDEGVLRFLVVLNDDPPTPAVVTTAKADFEEDD